MQKVVAIGVGAALASGEKVTPVQKIIQLLNGMVEKGETTKHEEAKQFAAYDQFCTDTSEAKGESIAKGLETQAATEAGIEANNANIAQHNSIMDTESANINKLTAENKAADEADRKAWAAFTKKAEDYAQSVSALKRAIDVLNSRPKKVDQAALLQVAALTMSPSDLKDRIHALLQAEQEPAAAGYEFQSNSIIDIMKDLLTKFQDEKLEFTKAAHNERHAHQMEKQDKIGMIEASTDNHGASSDMVDTNEAEKGENQGTLSATLKQIKADTEYKADLDATCAKKRDAMKVRVTVREDELAALRKAIEILGSPAVAGAADKHLPAMLMQIEQADPRTANIAGLIAKKAEQIHSKTLRAFAVSLMSTNNPFKKIVRMMKDLITRLKDEAGSEMKEQKWCENALASNNKTQTRQKKQVKKFTIKKTDAGAKIEELKTDIANLLANLKADKKAMAEATEQRHAEKAENAATIKDAQEAIVAVRAATKVLSDYYQGAGQSSSLVQQTPPPIFEAEYKGMQSENGGVVGMMEVIHADFVKLESDTRSSEQAAIAAYNTFQMETEKTISANEAEKDFKTKEKLKTEEDFESFSKSLDSHTGLLKDAVDEYEGGLYSRCVETGISHEERMEQRKQEIDSLKEALEVLSASESAR